MKYDEYHSTVYCKGLTTLTYYDGEAVRVNKTIKESLYKNTKIQCWYRDTTYNRQVVFIHGNWEGPFEDFILAKTKPEFIEAMCTHSGTQKTVSRMHHYITRSEIRKEQQKEAGKTNSTQTSQKGQHNVIILGVDSLSSGIFKRAMPKSRKYLLENLGALELNKYNKVGDNTFPNLLAILAGIFEHEPKNWSYAQGFDELPFVWKEYKKAGYRTQYTSDRTDFDDFVKQPTDSYNFPMMSALMTDKIAFNNDCFEDKNEVKLWLDLIIEFAKDAVFSGRPFFSVGMIKRPTHDFPPKASAVDERYEAFFKELNTSNILNNTFLIFFGDHGPRAGAFRRTFLGSIEERAANMVVYVPPWFKQAYPQHFANLKTNQNRLTTNFDIHETLHSILDLSKNNNDNTYKTSRDLNNDLSVTSASVNSKQLPRGISLFVEIPPERTCIDAQIDAQNCLCNGGVSVTDESITDDIGKQVVAHINDLLQEVRDKCAALSLKKVNSLAILTGKVGWSATYRVMLQTQPGDAEFEATVEYNVKFIFFKSIKILSYISRVNKYRGQSDCVDYDKKLRMYCYCKNLLR